MEILLRKLIAQTKSNLTVYNILVTPSSLTSRQVQEILIIEIPFGRLSLHKQSEQCRRTAGKINIHEISNYQLSKDQLDNTVMYDIKQQITCLLNEFNQNNSGMKSAHTNNSIKENIIKLKKKVKTSESLHAYYKILLKEKLDHFHIHVNQRRYEQMKSRHQTPNTVSNKPKSVIKTKLRTSRPIQP